MQQDAGQNVPAAAVVHPGQREGAEQVEEQGVELQDGRANAYCLRGTCSLYLGRSAIPFDASSKISLAIDTRSIDSLRAIPMGDVDRTSWMNLCSTWQLQTEAVSLACQLLLP